MLKTIVIIIISIISIIVISFVVNHSIGDNKAVTKLIVGQKTVDFETDWKSQTNSYMTCSQYFWVSQNRNTSRSPFILVLKWPAEILVSRYEISLKSVGANRVK